MCVLPPIFIGRWFARFSTLLRWAVGRSVINQGARSTLTEVDKVAPESQSLAQQIRELSELKDAGIISQQEFESAKQKLLSWKASFAD